MTDAETYLGDGLYASYDGYQIKLRAPRDIDGGEGDHVVFLEDSVLSRLLAFVENTRGLIIHVKEKARQ